MKTVKSIWKLIRKKELTNGDRNRIDIFFTNVKIAFLTLLFVLFIIFFISSLYNNLSEYSKNEKDIYNIEKSF